MKKLPPPRLLLSAVSLAAGVLLAWACCVLGVRLKALLLSLLPDTAAVEVHSPLFFAGLLAGIVLCAGVLLARRAWRSFPLLFLALTFLLWLVIFSGLPAGFFLGCACAGALCSAPAFRSGLASLLPWLASGVRDQAV